MHTCTLLMVVQYGGYLSRFVRRSLILTVYYMKYIDIYGRCMHIWDVRTHTYSVKFVLTAINPYFKEKTASRISKSLIHPIATCMAIDCTYPTAAA